jgi:hypothetical protein
MRMIPILQALRFHNRSTAGLEAIAPAAWPDMLLTTDRERLTLPIGIRCRDSLPGPVVERIDRNLSCNAERRLRLIAAHREIAGSLQSRGLEFVVLKGLSQWPYFTADPLHRPQYDIDLYFPEDSVDPARRAVASLGYESVHSHGDPHADHLPVMIRRTGWKWRGDYFDPEMPFSVELHFRFWDRHTERFSANGVEPFWRRRTVRDVPGLRLPTLSAPDGLTYTTLHLVRHLLRGDLRLHHVYELAHFMEQSAADHTFWSKWASHHTAGGRLIEAIAFQLAAEWFHCGLHPAARAAVEQLPPRVKRWFELFALSPVEAIDRPCKNELWLHLCLVNAGPDRLAVALRRLFPVRRARVVLDAHATPHETRPALRAKRLVFEARFMVQRAIYHVRALLTVVRGGLRWSRAHPGSP